MLVSVKLTTLWPFSGTCVQHRFLAPETSASRLVPKTMTHFASKNKDGFYHDRSLTHYTKNYFVRTVLWVKKCFHHSTSCFLFVYKQPSRDIVCSNWPAFQPVSSKKLNMLYQAPVSGTGKVSQTDQFLVLVDWYQKQASETGQCVITIRVRIVVVS